MPEDIEALIDEEHHCINIPGNRADIQKFYSKIIGFLNDKVDQHLSYALVPKLS